MSFDPAMPRACPTAVSHAGEGMCVTGHPVQDVVAFIDGTLHSIRNDEITPNY